MGITIFLSRVGASSKVSQVSSARWLPYPVPPQYTARPWHSTKAVKAAAHDCPSLSSPGIARPSDGSCTDVGPAKDALGPPLGPASPAPPALSRSIGDSSLLDGREMVCPTAACSASLDAPEAAPPAIHGAQGVYNLIELRQMQGVQLQSRELRSTTTTRGSFTSCSVIEVDGLLHRAVSSCEQSFSIASRDARSKNCTQLCSRC